MTEHASVSQPRGSVARITEREYLRSRRHQFAGPLSELLFVATVRRYQCLGATHWQLVYEEKGTALRPVIVDG